MPHIKFVDELYKARISFAWNESDQKLIKLVNKEMDDEYANLEQLEACHARFYYSDYDFFIVLRKAKLSQSETLSLVAHECLHLTSKLLRDRGFTLQDETDEAFAYHLQWLLGKCLQAMLGKNKKI